MTQINVKRILAVVPRLDSPADSIGYGRSLAQGYSAELDVMHYCPADEDRDLTDERRQVLELAWKGETEVPVSLHSVQGDDLSQALASFQGQRPFDMVVKAEHHSQFKMTADWQVVRNTPVPVILLTERPRENRKRVLVAMELGHRCAKVQRLNRKLLREAKAFARVQNSELHVLYVPRLMKFLRDLEIRSEWEVVTRVRKMRQQELEWLADEGIAADRIHLKTGEPSRVVWEQSESLKVHTLALGCFGRRGLLAKLKGNTAERLISRLHCDLMVVPADADA